MDGIHDLGGKEGYGPIDVDEPEEPFHAPWEGRMWAISRNRGAPGCTIDWWRHVRELIEPADYLTRPYFDQWAQTELAVHIDAGVFSLEEVIAGRSSTEAVPQGPGLDRAGALDADRARAFRFDREIDAAPRFAPGDRIRTSSFGHPHHTRLPEYARGREGTVHAHHGAHIFADDSARGIEHAQHIYSVVFEAEELWPEAEGRRDRIYLDLWESYLEPA
jgi:nitrile hydratase